MKERRFDVLKTYVKTSFFCAFMSKDEHNKNFFESVIILNYSRLRRVSD